VRSESDWQIVKGWPVLSAWVPIFVFDSNEKGIHGGGAAKDATKWYGARWGQGFGLQGESFAIPTKADVHRVLPLDEIQDYVDQFLAFAREYPHVDFQVTRIGCGYAGYSDAEIAPMFQRAPENCHLPLGWRDIIRERKQAHLID
jgi:hypothetical protein